MARYILIERNSGYIWADSATFDGKLLSDSPISLAAAIDSHTGIDGAIYDLVNHPSAEAAYDVYRVDINGSEAVPAVIDGMDQDTIDAVVRDCSYEGSICVTLRDDL